MAKDIPSIPLNVAVVRLLLLCAFACPAMADGTPTDESLIELAKTAILDVPFDTDAPFLSKRQMA